MTKNPKADSEVLRQVLIEEAKQRAGEHPALDILVEYLAGELDSKEDDLIQDHLAGCRGCVSQLLDIEPLLVPDEASGDVADLELEAAWRELRSRTAASADRPPSRTLRWPEVIAASLLAVTVGSSLWVTQLRRTTSDLRRQVAELSGPQINLPVFYLDELTRGPGREPEAIELPSRASYFVLIFASAGIGAFDDYEVRFFDSSGAEALRVGGLEADAGGGVRLGLSRDTLPEGDYLIRLLALDGGRWRPLDEYRRRVSVSGDS
jgi:hypothetical protein